MPARSTHIDKGITGHAHISVIPEPQPYQEGFAEDDTGESTE